ncbi:toll-like receptor 6 [Varanus komodoensis]|uniref:toll-like receptor 6 n=1 Tax=Varanus komodoensis TaxID=61221 RepID=UPI001CF7AD46|nr:toll-like receptor 6 [Varanus komodoensis]
MAENKSSGTCSFLCTCILTTAFWSIISTTAENVFKANYSKKQLVTVPMNLSTQTTVLDLSHNNITELQMSDFHSLSRLQTLILSYNRIREFDFSVFQYNTNLEHLDVSHNNLQMLSCHPMLRLRHLDLSYNNYTAMPICPKTGKTLKLEYLGLSLKRIQKSDFHALAHLQLDTLFLGLEYLSEYSSGNLPVFSAKNLQIVLPLNTEFRILLDLELNITENLQLSKIEQNQVSDLSTFLLMLNKNGRLQNLTVSNGQLSWECLLAVFKIVWQSTVEYFTVDDTTITEFSSEPLHDIPTSVKALVINNAKFNNYLFDQKIVYQSFSDMNIEFLTIVRTGLVHMVCPSKPSQFTYINFSDNALTDSVFQGCNHLTLLETLVLQSNSLKELRKVSAMAALMQSLKDLDLSKNLLQYEDNRDKCLWGEMLVKLNLSSNVLSESVFWCLPVNIQILDLQDNHISSVPKEMIELNNLKELHLAFNKLSALPGCGHFRGLQLLNVESNLVASNSSEFLQSCQNIRTLKGGHNPFMCSCELRPFINLEKQGSVEFVGWPDLYTCDYPQQLKGTPLTDFHVSEVACNVTLLMAVVLIVTVVALVAISVLCICLDIPWYLKMTWHWSQVKHRGWKRTPEHILKGIEFHAFISYSERDSDWVKNVLIPNLEKEDSSIRICQHERNFVAGKSIVENIIDCTEKSYKTIFVLSPNFVQSDWCHYELYFAQHKVFSENADNLILVLLEPIPKYVIPSRYHKLKALMAKRTYLEWPKEKSKHALFWANLRAAIQITLPQNEGEMQQL